MNEVNFPPIAFQPKPNGLEGGEASSFRFSP